MSPFERQIFEIIRSLIIRILQELDEFWVLLLKLSQGGSAEPEFIESPTDRHSICDEGQDCLLLRVIVQITIALLRRSEQLIPQFFEIMTHDLGV